MANILSHVYAFLAGAACMGAWWWWINHRAKARAAIQEVQNVARKL